MNRFTNAVLLMTAAALLTAPAHAQKTAQAETLLEAARQKETLDGDLASAIKQYQAIVDRFRTSDRAVVATALVRLADCYRKLGDDRARNIYEQVIRDYADQKAAVTTARAQLAGAKSAARPAGPIVRTVWDGPKVDPGGSISPDGRLLTFSERETGDLAIHDLVTGTDSRLTNKGGWLQSSALAEESVMSRDGKHVAYAWCDCRNRYSLRIVDTKAMSPPRVLFDNESVAWIAPFDWSPDGKRIAVQLLRQDDGTAQIGWVEVADGSLHVLKSVDWRRSGKLLFSPDGKYLAFDLPVDDTTQRDVFLTAVDGSREITIAANPGRDVVVGWSPDGGRLLFASDRSGSTGLWAMAIRDGRPVGSAELLKSDIGQIGQRPLGLSATGTLYFASAVGGMDVYIEALDFSTGHVVVPASKTGEKLLGFNRQPDWSPDGKFLAYVSSRARNGRDTTALAIQSVESGKVIRELAPQLTYVEFPRWTPDGRSVVAYGWDLKGGNGIYRIDSQTGATLKIAEGDLHGPQVSPDGKTIYGTLYGETMAIVEVDVASGRQRELMRGKELSIPALSPDGRVLAVRSSDASAKSSVLLLATLDSGEVKERWRVSQPESLEGNAVSWTADGRGVIVRKGYSGRPSEVVMIPANGGEPRTLEISVPRSTAAPMRVHPDGQRIAFTAGQSTWEISALENFLPR